MPKNITEKLVAKRLALIQRTAAALQVSDDQATALLSIERRQSVRVNPLKGGPTQTLAELQESGWQGEQYTWVENGYTIDTPLKTVRDSQAVQKGRAFIQNAASWLPVLALNPHAGELILDVCAAPGGKTSHIAAIVRNKAQIVANDNSRPRLSKMQANLSRLGVSCAQTTLFDATQLVRKFEGQQFDKILLDAPCSGEGMMHLASDKDFTSWSVAHIKRLQHLQKRIIGQAWQLLKPGGTLVYSTCTMAPEENESIVSYLLRTHSNAAIEPLGFDLPNRVASVQAWNGRRFDERIKNCVRLTPSRELEAFFVCKFIKTEGE